MDLHLINEETYCEFMNGTVIPTLDHLKYAGTFERHPGETICYERFDADDARAIVVISHGFTESMIKFYEPVWYFLRNGYSVWAIEHRGHGNSYRTLQDNARVQLEDPHALILDLHHFVKHVITPANKDSLPLYLYAHSMGGGIGACVLEHYPNDFKKAVLTAPMLELNSKGAPVFAAWAAASLMKRLKKGDRVMSGISAFPEAPLDDDECSTSRARYEWYFGIQKAHPEYQTCAVTWTTALTLLAITREAARNTDRVRADVLLFQAETDTMVEPGGQERFIAAIPHGRLMKIPGSRHEIYRSDNSVLQGYWEEIFRFFG